MRVLQIVIGCSAGLFASVASAADPHRCSINGTCGQVSIGNVQSTDNGQKIVLSRSVASVAPEPVARGSNDKPLVLASAYADPTGMQDKGKKMAGMGLAYWAPKATDPLAPKPASSTGNAIIDTMANAGYATTGFILQAQGVTAEQDLRARAERSLKADGGLGAGQTDPAIAEAMVRARTQALQVYLGDPNLKPTGLDNARGLRTVDFGGGTKANVHSLPAGQTMELGGTKFTGGPAPGNGNKIGYFVPQELKPGTQVFTGDSGNKQATIKVGDKSYAIFFPPGTTDDQMKKGLTTAKAALENGMDPTKIAADFREKNSTTDPAAALKGLENYADANKVPEAEMAAARVRLMEGIGAYGTDDAKYERSSEALASLKDGMSKDAFAAIMKKSEGDTTVTADTK